MTQSFTYVFLQNLLPDVDVIDGYLIPIDIDPIPVENFKLIVRLSEPSLVKVSHTEIKVCIEPTGICLLYDTLTSICTISAVFCNQFGSSLDCPLLKFRPKIRLYHVCTFSNFLYVIQTNAQ